MMTALKDFFYMNGHGIYVFSAYASVIALLITQWLIPWKKWRTYLNQQKKLALEKNKS